MTDQYDAIVLMDPELALPDDHAALGALDGASIHVVGSYQARYSTFPQVIEHRRQIEAEWGADVQPWQAAIEAPAFVVRLFKGTTIYGELLTPAEAVARDGEPRLDVRVADAARRGWLYGKWYSVIEPKGETGCNHRSLIERLITADEFAAAREAGWT